MIATTPRSKASSSNLPISTPEADAPADPASALPDLLAGLRLGAREWIVVAAVLLAVDAFAGWTYLVSYFSYFRIPSEALGLSAPEVLAQGLRTVLLPLTVVIVAVLAPGPRLRPAAIGVGVYLLVLLAVAVINHWASPGAVLVQLVAALAAAGIVFGMRLGLGARPFERLVIGAAGLLLLIPIPVAAGTPGAGPAAGGRLATFRPVTSGPGLPQPPSPRGEYTDHKYTPPPQH